MVEELRRKLKGRTPVILCIGSDKFIFDSLGAIVGHMLVAAKIKAYVYGTLEKPVNALNLKGIYGFIRKKHVGSPVLAVDSCIGSKVGKIALSGAICPASARGVDMGLIGDVSITAVTGSAMDNSVALGDVYRLAEKIVEVITKAI